MERTQVVQPMETIVLLLVLISGLVHEEVFFVGGSDASKYA